jgi:hypothetical protein
VAVEEFKVYNNQQLYLPLSNFTMSTSAPTADTPSYVTADFSLVPVSPAIAEIKALSYTDY